MKSEVLEKMSILGFSAGCQSTATMNRSHRHHEIEVNFIQRGAITYLFRGSPRQIKENQLALFWATTPHQVIHEEPATRLFWLTLPLPWVLQWKLGPNILDRLIQGQLLLEDSEDTRDASAFVRWTQDLKYSHPELIKITALEIEARLRRFAFRQAFSSAKSSRSFTSGAKVNSREANHVATLAKVVSQRYGSSVKLQEIAQAAQLHPNYATALFKKVCGISLMNYVTQHRLFHAQRLLMTTDMKMIDVAFSSGFGSLSRFYEAYQAHFKKSPQGRKLKSKKRSKKSPGKDPLLPTS
jgi:AraC family transcriptional regulator, melibiose operon regulatory protein